MDYIITAQLQENENSIEDASKGQIAVLDDIDETLQDTMQFLEENTKELTKMVGEKTTDVVPVSKTLSPESFVSEILVSSSTFPFQFSTLVMATKGCLIPLLANTPKA